MLKRIFFITAALFLVLLPMVLLFFRIGAVRQEQERSFQRLFEAMEASAETENLLKQAVQTLGEENNKLRRALNLPEQELQLLKPGEDGSEADGSSEENRELPFYTALEYLEQHQKELAAAARLDTFLSDTALEMFTREENIDIRRPNRGSTAFLLNENELGTIRLDVADTQDTSDTSSVPSFTFSSPGGDEEGIQSPRALISLLERRLDEVRKAIHIVQEGRQILQKLHASSRLRSLALERDLLITPYSKTALGGRFSVTTLDEIPLFDVSVSKEIISIDGETVSPDQALEKLETALLQADPRGRIERAMDSAKEQIISLGRDDAFRSFLEKRDLRLLDETREDNDYFYFDLLDSRGERAGAFGVQKGSGDIYLADSEDVILGSLKRLSLTGDSSPPAPMELPSDEILASLGKIGGEGKNILLIGSHENNADTIMVARLTDTRASLIALPRDIWWKQRKLNAYFRIYGAEAFMQVVGELTGLPIHDYLVVDMYAFIDVVNILGGIDVTLEEALIDPTYKIREQGVWKTLHYPRGTHHLDGVAALRIARSRHTSDDFDRAERQQLIISALKERVDQMGVSDIGAVYQLFQSLSTYVSTSFSPFEMAKLYLDNRSVDIRQLGGISTDNVLEATYSNLLAAGKSEDEVDDDFYKGAWILFPREGNWKLIPWYIQELLGEDS